MCNLVCAVNCLMVIELLEADSLSCNPAIPLPLYYPLCLRRLIYKTWKVTIPSEVGSLWDCCPDPQLLVLRSLCKPLPDCGLDFVTASRQLNVGQMGWDLSFQGQVGLGYRLPCALTLRGDSTHAVTSPMERPT